MAYRNTGNLVVGSPFAPLFGLRREIDRLFDDTFTGRHGASTWFPAIDIRESNKELCLDVELPGIKPENVELSVENGVLTVRGEKQSSNMEEDGQWHVVERSYGSFQRSFQLPQGVEDGKITADFNDGVLTIRVPKPEIALPRKIRISGRDQQVPVTQGREPASAGGDVKNTASEKSAQSKQTKTSK